MKRILAASVLAAAILGAPLMGRAQNPPPKTEQAKVPVKVVVLFSSGVGYFEHSGSIDGNASTELRFKTAQINDILKSLVLQDTGKGKVSTVVYPSQDPVSKILGSFQVNITSNPPLAELLNQLRGASVKVTAGTENLTGTILGAEKKPKAVDKATIEIWQLNLLAGGAIRSVSLDDVQSIALQDPQLQEELTKALAALAQARDQDKKPVTIHFQGQGNRQVRIGYVVESPVWKTSYRLLLAEKPALQGWAIVENQTDNDWNDVQMSLVSGRPISFIENLYQPLYIPRPLVQPELYASLRPQTYDEGLAMGRGAGIAGGPGGGAGGAMLARRAAPAAAAPGLAVRGSELAESERAATAYFDKPMDASASVASVASATKIGELFEYSVGSVTLPRQRSAMIPIITDPIDVEKLSIYNQSVLPKHPLYGAMVKNSTTKHLLQGPITVFQDGVYAGDARIDNLPPGQQRLISYGIDLQVVVNSTKNTHTSNIISGKIVKGVLNLKHKQVFTQDYVAENKDEKDKTLVIEHPLRRGWDLIDSPKPFETTDALYRIKVPLPAGKPTSTTIKEQTVTSESIAILPMDTGAMDFYLKSDQISQSVKDALSKAAAYKRQMVDCQRQVDASKAELNQITQDQARIRENIKAAPDKSALKTRLLEKLEEQEKRVDQLYGKVEDQQKAFEKARKELEDYLANLNVED